MKTVFKKILFVLFACFLIVPTIASAATFKAEKTGSTVIDSGEVVKNAYLAGNDVSVIGEVTQDLVAAGNNISVSGMVNDSANIVGNSIVVSGTIGKSLRTMGSTIIINSNIGSDVFAAGSSISLGRSQTVGGDFSAAGATININGAVRGSAYLAAGQITINGPIDGNVTIKGGDKVTIGPDAVIKGNLKYQAQSIATISPEAKILGTTDFTKMASQGDIGSQFKVGLTLFSLLMSLASFILLLILIYVFPKTIRNVVEKSLTKPWDNLGIGFVYLIVVPVAAMILLITIIGLPIGGLAIGLYALTLGLAKIIVPIVVGSLIFMWLGKNKNIRIDWLTALVGLVVVFIVGLIPFFGSLALFIVFLMILSLFARAGLELVKSQK